jgi:phosphoribosylglycinamide formyltransferase-1
VTNIAIFASGSGTNAENIIKYFSNSDTVKVNLVLANKKDAFVLKRIKPYNIEGLFLPRSEFRNTETLIPILDSSEIDFIVLAGFLQLIPEFLIEKYPKKIINIHPALLPKFGGKGMYGSNVHRAVLEAKEKESGISIHYVNEHFDEGELIFQSKFPINENTSLEELERKIHIEEYDHYPRIIEKTINLNLN